MKHPQTDTNFASAVMMRLISAGLSNQGLGHLLRSTKGAHVPRDTKRAFLQYLSKERGFVTILRLADAVTDMPPEPVVLALKKAKDLEDLFSRWHRVEKFSHSSHTVDAVLTDGELWRLKHRSKRAGESPVPEESLLVIAVLTRLGELTDGTELTLHTACGNVLRKDGEWQAPNPSEVDGSFVLSGGKTETIPLWMPDGQETLIAATKGMMAEDLARRWTIEDVAHAMGHSRRSLQRKFNGCETTFSSLVAEVRLEAAAEYLCSDEKRSLAEIGFLTGYSDQAHFSRSFVREVGTTPKAYQSSFAS